MVMLSGIEQWRSVVAIQLVDVGTALGREREREEEGKISSSLHRCYSD